MSEELILRPDLVLVVPNGSTGNPLVFNMKSILKAEQRLIEVQSITREKAGELMAVYNEAWRECRNYMTALTRHLNSVERWLDEEKARIVLEVVPRYLKENGLASPRSPTGSEDIRSAIIARDPAYKAVAERKDQIQGAIEWLDIKAKAFERGYFSVQRLTDNKYHRPNHILSGGVGDADVGERSPDEPE